jgi:hypothetical protein
MKLRIANDLSLPLEAVTQTIAILAKRRAGKSYTMRRLVEQLFQARQQVVMVDPKGDQWGVRSAADGKAPGMPIVILGGERGDVPLESSSGEVVAKLVVEERVSVLLDLSLFRKSEVATFMTAFMENLYRLKAREIYRTPMMLVIDEADAIAPQKPQKGEERMLGAAEDIVRRGGQRGIGCVLVTQRSAVLNKNVLTQAQMLVALRTIAPQDLAAMNAWIDVHGTPEQRKTLMESLPSLPIGDAWFWSPGWPTAEGIFKRTHVLPIETFDSGKSPEPGVKPVEPKNLADVDLDALKGQMAATIEKAKADDPKLLRKRIAELEKGGGPTPAWRAEYEGAHARDTESAYNRGLAAGQKAQGPLRKGLEEAVKFIVEINTKGFSKESKQAVRKGEIEKAMADAAKSVEASIERHMGKRAQELESLSRQSQQLIKRLTALLEGDVKIKIDVKHNQPFTVSPTVVPPLAVTGAGNGGLPPGEHATLKAALQYPGLDRKRLSVLTGYKRSSRDAYIARLVQKGFVETRGQELHPTPEGAAAIGNFEPLPTGADLIEYWRGRLPEGEKKTLEVLIAASGEDVDREKIDEQTGYKRSSRDAYLTRLKARGLVEFSGRGMVRASAELF